MVRSTPSESSNLPRQIDIAAVCVYGLSILSVGLFLFLPLANLLSPSPWQRYMGTIQGFAHFRTSLTSKFLFWFDFS